MKDVSENGIILSRYYKEVEIGRFHNDGSTMIFNVEIKPLQNENNTIMLKIVSGDKFWLYEYQKRITIQTYHQIKSTYNNSSFHSTIIRDVRKKNIASVSFIDWVEFDEMYIYETIKIKGYNFE